MLSQLIHVYNDGEEIDWTSDYVKYVVDRSGNNILACDAVRTYKFIAFYSKERRDLFLKNFEPLIKEYFMID